MPSHSITQISQTTAVHITGSVIPLTQVITFPSDCNQESAFETAYSSGGTIGYNTDPSIQNYSCYPSSYKSYQWQTTGWYSPGVCPSAYEWVATSRQGPTTLAICCPPGFFTKGDEWSCSQLKTKQLPGDASVTVAFANPISVAWQSSDLDKFVPKSAPLLALASQTGGSLYSSSSSSSSSSATASSTTGVAPSSSSPNTNTSDLSTGAKAGIGAGAAVAGLAIIAGMFYWFFRRYKSTQNPLKAGGIAQDEKRDIHGEHRYSPMAVQPVTELDAAGTIHEAADTAIPVEASTMSSPQELEGDMVPELSHDGSRGTSHKASGERR